METKNFVCDCDVVHEDVVNSVRGVMPANDKFSSEAEFFKMFADSTRLKILWALSCKVLCVCDLAVLLDMTKSAISHQLKTLRLAGLVKYDKKGKIVYYSIADGRVRDMLERAF